MNAFARSTLPVVNVLGYVVMIFAFTMLVPLLFALVGGDRALKDDALSMLITAAAGVALVLATTRYRRELQPRDGFLLVTLVWTVLPAFATLPLMFHLPGLSFTYAYFETMSGLTTTGATVLSGLDELPLSINVWRHLLVWIGGMGILVLVVAIMPLLGVGGSQLFKAETAGPIKEAKLTPRIADTAKALYAMYFGISIACFFAYRWAGMSWSDAFLHMCSTMGLGGFSSHDASFCLLEFAGHRVHGGRLHGAGRVQLLDALPGVAQAVAEGVPRRPGEQGVRRHAGGRVRRGGPVPAVARASTPTSETSFRYAVFNVVSVATTTGYASTDYAQWPSFAPILMLFLCGFATCAGSTGGGIKMIRGLILLKQARREMSRILHPRAVNPIVIGGQVIENKVIFAVLAFMLVYGAALTSLTFLMMLLGRDAITAFTAIVACLNNMGPGLNLVGPAANYGVLAPVEIWICTFAMLIGRLELFTVLVLLTPMFWRR